MKKIQSLIYIIIVCLSLCSCGHKVNNYDGKELLDKAAKLHTGLESAHIIVRDNLSMETVQEISYRFEGEVMQYMYVGYDSETGRTYCEYNNGTELNYITLPEETKWSFIAKGSEGYYTYSKASRHYFADGAQLFADYEGAVSTSFVTEDYWTRTLHIDYDVTKLSQYSALAAYGEFSDFDIMAAFDADGYCYCFDNVYTTADGTKSSYSVLINPRDEQLPIERKTDRTVFEIEE